jgi:hypothetical protein
MYLPRASQARWPPMAHVISGAQYVTSAADGAAIERRIRIKRLGDDNARCKSPSSAQGFLSVHAAVHNNFIGQRQLTSARTHRVFLSSASHT